MRLSVRNKMIAGGFVLLVIPGVSIGLVSVNSAQMQVNKQVTNAAVSSVNLFNKIITNFLDNSENSVDFLAKDLNGKETDITAVDTELNHFAQTHSQFLHTYMGTDHGDFILRPYGEVPAGYDPRKRPWYQQAMQNKGRVVITPPYQDASTGQMVVTRHFQMHTASLGLILRWLL